MRRSFPPVLGALMVATLAAATACDKKQAADPDRVLPEGVAALDLASRPTVLFQVFGDPKEPKIMPIAAVVNGAVHPIGLSRAGWREFDSTYFAAGARYPVYVDDSLRGNATVTRGMWVGHDEPLFQLPGCRNLKPLGATTLDFAVPANEPTVEFIAASAPLAAHPKARTAFPAPSVIASLGRTLGHQLGERNRMDAAELDSLDFTARMLATGVHPDPTLLVSFIDQQAGDVAPGVGHSSHILALFDKADTGYVATYRHVASGDARSIEFQRFVDRVDVDGDGIDELILEAWHYGGSNELIVLASKAGQWHEILRTSSNLCLDPPSGGKK